MNARIISIDALRGLDMLLLCGGAAVLHLFIAWGCGDAAPAWLVQQFRHAEWGGAFICWDLVMPLFIFITGASMPFAFAGYREKEARTGASAPAGACCAAWCCSFSWVCWCRGIWHLPGRST